MIYGRSTNSVICTGSAASIVYQQGVEYANGEFVQFHPTAMLGDDKTRLMSEASRVKEGRSGPIKTISLGTLEEWYPVYGNLVP